ncbi:hypothetical protein [Fusobacterium varium]|nr:hypothetical protein [Fusobacterium varium]
MFESLKNYPLGGMNKSTGLDVLDKKKMINFLKKLNRGKGQQ